MGEIAKALRENQSNTENSQVVKGAACILCLFRWTQRYHRGRLSRTVQFFLPLAYKCLRILQSYYFSEVRGGERKCWKTPWFTLENSWEKSSKEWVPSILQSVLQFVMRGPSSVTLDLGKQRSFRFWLCGKNSSSIEGISTLSNRKTPKTQTRYLMYY